MATEKPQYSRIESDSTSTPASPPTSTPSPPRTLRHKVSRALSTLTRRDPTSPDRDRAPPLPTPTALSPTSPSSPSSPATGTDTSAEKRKEPSALKRTWSRSVAIARTRSEPALRAKRAKAAAAALIPPPPALPPPVATTHSRDVNAYAYGQRRDVSEAYPLWRLDPVLVGCFVCI